MLRFVCFARVGSPVAFSRAAAVGAALALPRGTPHGPRRYFAGTATGGWIMRGVFLWMLGVPFTVIVLLYVFNVL